MPRRLAALALFAALFCLGCDPSAPPASTVIYGRGEDANTLDPINTQIGESVNVILQIFDTLVTYAEDSAEIVPALATKWEHSADGLTWTFDLREDVKFQDGTPLNAAAVKFSFDRLLQPDHPAVYDKARPYQPNFKMIAEVIPEGEHRVVFKLSAPSAIFLQNMTMFPASIVSPTAVEKLKDKFAEQPVGTGPFQMVRWDRDQKIVLSAFEYHWRGKPKAEHLIFVPVKESATRIEQLKRGEIHIADNLPPAELDALAKLPNIVIQEQSGMNVGYLTMQMEKAPFTNANVRKAFALAIDKATLIKVAYAGHGAAAVTMVPNTMWAHHQSLADYPFDPAQARELLAAAAKEDGFELPLKITLAYMNQPRPYMQQPIAVAGFVKDALRDIGVEVTLEPRDVNEHFKYVDAGKHQLALAGWYSDNADPDNFLYSLLDPDNISEVGNNLSRYRNEEVHQLLLAGQTELDEAKRLAIYLKVQELVLADVPTIPLIHTNTRVAQSPKVRGFKLHPTGVLRLRNTYLEGAK